MELKPVQSWHPASRVFLLMAGIAVVLNLTQSCFTSHKAVALAPALITISTHRKDTVLEEQQYQQWLSSFRAADPAYQDYCLKVLKNSERQDIGAQYSQDIFVFQNIFKSWPAAGKKGFYIESGANDALKLSSSLFFDKCLGWAGLCIEPQPDYHRDLRQRRSCTLVPECIAASKGTMKMSAAGSGSAVSVGGTVEVQCAPIADILARYTNGSQTHVDLWVLDVEGYEMTVLDATDFSSLQVDVMIIEDHWLNPVPRVLDITMGVNGFFKFQQLAIDSVFVRRSSPLALTAANPTWFHPKFKDDQAEVRVWVSNQGVQADFRKAWGWA